MRGLMELYSLGMRDEEYRGRFAVYYETLIAACEKVIRHGIERGEVASDIDPASVARILCTGGDGLLFIHFVLGEHEKGLQCVMEMTELLLRAISVKEV